MSSFHSGTRNGEIAVCLVDDDEIMQDIISRYLVRLGCKLEVAVNPQNALELMANANFNLILSDLCMPDMEDGLNLISRIKAIDPTLPVAVMSAEMSQSTQDTLLAAGAFACLAKPISSDDLAKILEELSTLQTTKMAI